MTNVLELYKFLEQPFTLQDFCLMFRGEKLMNYYEDLWEINSAEAQLLEHLISFVAFAPLPQALAYLPVLVENLKLLRV